MRLFSHEKLTISVEETQGLKYIKEEWSGILTSTIFHKLIYQSLDIYKKELKALKGKNDHFLLLADVSKLELISSKDIEWLTDEINPKYEELGFTKQAVIVPKSQMAQTTVAEYEGQTGGFDTKMFTDELAAKRWFLSLKNEE
ncbi:hypothetical protein [Fulvivirga lutea]|uniref:STAS/SEC14 domain-containing protein n=1 Tax=Fulvivirga lutea TaxID=2810512 RepID=A0A974WL85_9BACT|nr:hypothetical protein [Fulvivirga lutea]QSE97428.1 hypothetical protein JR347_17900 [Fulvivirga lutea]